MDWLAFALSSAAIFAVVTIIDQVMVDKSFTDPLIYSLFIWIWAAISATFFVVLAGGWQSLPNWSVGVALLAGGLKVGATTLYFKALSQTDASLVSTAQQTRPVFALACGLIFFQEQPQFSAFWGMALLTLLMITMSLNFSELGTIGIRLHRIAIPITLSNILYAIADAYLKFARYEANADNAFFWQTVGALITVACFMVVWPTGRKRMKAMLAAAKGSAKVYSFFNEILASIAGWLHAAALGIGMLAPVSVVGATQPIWVLVFVMLINHIRPGTLKESQEKMLVPRWAALLLLSIGVYLLAV